MPSNRRIFLSLAAALALAALAIGIAGCGYSENSKHVEEGQTVKLGDLKYEVVLSRYLNPYDNEDSAYLVGQPPPPNGSNYFGVFLQVKNESNESQKLASTVKITDVTGKIFKVIPSKSLFALPLGGEVEAQEQVPTLSSIAQQGPIEGSMALFLLPEEVSSNRPLTLHIPGANGEKAEVELDL